MSRTSMISVIGLLLLVLPAVAQLRSDPDSPCNQGRAWPPKVDPRDERAICLPESGRMIGTITKSKIVGAGEEFGWTVTPVMDTDGDGLADFVVSHVRCDTAFYLTPDDQYPKQPVELLLYRGVKGGLPDVRSGERVGPSEILTKSRMIGSGDFDGDGHRDLVVQYQILGDTSFGNTNAIVNLHSVVVFWGSVSGRYTIEDTTRLFNGVGAWIGTVMGYGADIDQDHVDDLFLNQAGKAFAGGERVDVPHVLIFKGRMGERWGRGTLGRAADWTWWNAPWSITGQATRLIDQDCDGAGDIVLYYNDIPSTTRVTILYGKGGGMMPDTNEVQSISLLYSNGHTSAFQDITGDGIPELIISCGSEERFKVHAGRAGQRLRQQYGPDSLPNTPWAEVWQAPKLNEDWFSDDGSIDLGDVNLDGVGDLVGYGWPYIVCYTGGESLDSLIDGLVRGPDIVNTPIRLGDIDGSGLPTFVFPYDQIPHNPIEPFPGGLYFFKPSRDVPTQHIWPRVLPHPAGYRCEHAPARIEQPSQPATARADTKSLVISARPNPSGRDVELVWSGVGAGDAVVTIVDISGREIARIEVDAARGRVVWDAASLPSGTYIASIRTTTGNAGCRVVLEP